MKRWLRRLGIIALGLVILATVPMLYVETACTAPFETTTTRHVLVGSSQQRPETRTYLTYPEWYIVHAYEDLARVLEERDEYAFAYWQSISGFWSSLCVLNRRATRSGDVDTDVKIMLYTIGYSFSAEMALKALYEETIGRVSAWLRGPIKSPQDLLAARMGADYAKFLQQTPWYRFDFGHWRQALWQLPHAEFPFRSWERNLALGIEWSAKAAYAALIGNAVGILAPAAERNHFVVSGLSEPDLKTIEGLAVVSSIENGRFIVEGPRYRTFSRILMAVAERGGTIDEIAGNDDILVSLLRPQGGPRPPRGRIIAVIARQASEDERLLVDIRVRDLGILMREALREDFVVEHVYDY